MQITKKSLQAIDMNARFLEFMNVVMVPIIIAPLTKKHAETLSLSAGFGKAVNIIYEQCIQRQGRLIFIGNGGSAAIASHQATDFFNNLNIDARAFNDPSLLTCMANDYGYENVFAKSIDVIGRKGDILAAISSSGKSPNILKGVEIAKMKECSIITMSGFRNDNPLRNEGDLNFYVPSVSYRIVEAAHSLYWDFILEMLIEKCKK